MSALRQSFAKGLVTMEDVCSRVIEQGVRTATYGIATAFNFVAIAALAITVGGIIGIKVWPDAATARNIAESNRELIEAGPAGIFTYNVDNLLGTDAETCGTTAEPCATVMYALSLIPAGKPITISLTANGPENPYTVQGDSSVFVNGFSQQITFMSPSQISADDDTPFSGWSNYVGTVTRTGLSNMSEPLSIPGTSPIVGRVLGIRSNTVSGNMGGLNQSQIRGAAINKDVSAAAVLRYNEANDALYATAGIITAGDSDETTVLNLYTPNCRIEFNNLTQWFPMRFYGVEVEFMTAAALRSEIVFHQSRIFFDESSIIDSSTDFRAYSTVFIIQTDAVVDFIPARLLTYDYSMFIATNNPILLRTTNALFSLTAFTRDEVGYEILSTQAASIQISNALLLGGITMRVGGSLDVGGAIFSYRYEDMKNPTTPPASGLITTITANVITVRVTGMEIWMQSNPGAQAPRCFSLTNNDLRLYDFGCYLQSDEPRTTTAFISSGGDVYLFDDNGFTTGGQQAVLSIVNVGSGSTAQNFGSMYSTNTAGSMNVTEGLFRTATNGRVDIRTVSRLFGSAVGRYATVVGVGDASSNANFLYDVSTAKSILSADVEASTRSYFFYGPPSSDVSSGFACPQSSYIPTIGGTATLTGATIDAARYTSCDTSDLDVSVAIDFASTFAVTGTGTITVDLPTGTMSNTVGSIVGQVQRVTGGTTEFCTVASTTTVTCTFGANSTAGAAKITFTYIQA